MNRLPDHPHQATRARTEQVEQKARAALKALLAVGRPISFAAVAKKAGISTDFLYRHVGLRAQI
ncbi:DUF6262 family protein [Streptosporangium sp. CA-135522]|uniref:DUF6262 family protein n=1 Tax=Streptosporangium sp. CA-135522 TaxID=3240072 RepID=UPI003D915453